MEVFRNVLSARGAIKTTVAILGGSLAVTIMLRLLARKCFNLPPGPWGVPLLGYLPFFGKAPPVTFTRLRKKYGDVIGITMGSWPAVVVCGTEAIKEALVTKGDDFAGRPAFTISLEHQEGRSLTFGAFDEAWKKLRKIAKNTLHAYTNASKVPLEDIVHDEVDTVVRGLLAEAKANRGVVWPCKTLRVAACSVMYQLCYGHHHNLRDNADFMQGIAKEQHEFQEFVAAGNVVDVMPWLRYFVGQGQVKRLRAFRERFYSLRNKKVREHEDTFSEANLRDIADGLIHAGRRLTQEDTAAGLDKTQLMGSLDDILGGGTDTVSSSLMWAVQLLATRPQLQQDIVAQIHSVLGHSRKPTLADRENLPLVEATVFEVLRYASVLPFTPPHQTTRDTTLGGYDIPAGTVVLVNLHSIHKDEQLWGDPHVFRPHRFLEASGKLARGLAEKVTAFSLGRRRCLGEGVARMELFLFLATLLQALRFSQPPGHPGYSEDGLWQFAHNTSPFQVAVEGRQ